MPYAEYFLSFKRLDAISGLKAIVEVIFLEVDFFKQNQRYRRVLDEDFWKQLEKIALDCIFNDVGDVRTVCNCIRICSIINFNNLLNKLLDKMPKCINDSTIESIVSSIFIYQNVSTANKCSQVLEKLDRYIDFHKIDISANYSDAVAEGAFHFRRFTMDNATDGSSYKIAYNNLLDIYQHPDRSHSEIQIVFSKLEQIVVENDLVDRFDNIYKGDNGLRHIFLNIILPSIDKLINTWPQDFMINLEYFNSEIYYDLSSLNSLLNRNYNKIKKGIMTAKQWKTEKQKIYDLLNKLNVNLFRSDKSILRQKLEEAQCQYVEVLSSCLATLDDNFNRNKITVRINDNTSNEISIIPKMHLYDIFYTILDNISTYSGKNTTSIIEINRIGSQIIIDFKSKPKNDHVIKKVPNHGLDNISLILERYDAKIEIVENGEKEPIAHLKIII